MKTDSPYNYSWPHRLPPDGIFVHRAVDLSRIKAIGLDLDHTLAVYAENDVNGLAQAETCDNLIRYKGYPAALAGLPYDSSLAARGLVLDLELGNTLKLDGGRQVIKIFHDREWQDNQRGLDRYPNRALDLRTPRFVTVDSTFDLPVAVLFAAAPRFAPRARDGGVEYSAFCADLREMLDRSHRLGRLKSQILDGITRFIRPVPGLRDKIESFAAAGKRLFLLTNSEYDYAVRVLDYLFSPGGGQDGWRGLFEEVFVQAEKPLFFTATRPPVTAEATGRRPAVRSGGGARALENILGVLPGEILYVGDNPFDDAAAARRRGWRTALVVPELAHPQPGGGAFPPGQVQLSGGSDHGWGDPLWDAGRPTFLARLAAEYSDLSAARIERYLSAAPNRVFDRV